MMGANDQSAVSVDSVFSGGASKSEDVLYTSGRLDSRRNGGVFSRSYPRGRYRGKAFNRGSTRTRRSDGPANRRLNPYSYDGYVTTCNVCDSKYHWAKACPHRSDLRYGAAASGDRSSVDTSTGIHFSMFVGCTSNGQKHGNLDDLVLESKGHAILDSGCTTTVCGERWLSAFLETLSDDDRLRIQFEPSVQSFTFGDGQTVISKRRLTLPCWMGGVSGEVVTEVVPCNIPLLLSRKSMKATGMILDFAKDEVQVGGRIIKLRITKSGHCALPISL